MVNPRNRYSTKATIDQHVQVDKHFDVRLDMSNTPKVVKAKANFNSLDRYKMRQVAIGFNRPKKGRSDFQ